MKKLLLLTGILCASLTLPAGADGFGKIVEHGGGDFWGDVPSAEESIYSPDNKPLCAREGLNVLHYTNGEIYIEAACEDGQLHGFYKEYSKNGLLAVEKNYLHGQLDGLLKTYHPNGQLAQSRAFINGEEQFAEQMSYDEKGQLIKKLDDNPENYIQVHDYIIVHKDFLEEKKKGLWGQFKTQTHELSEQENSVDEPVEQFEPQYEAYYMDDAK